MTTTATVSVAVISSQVRAQRVAEVAEWRLDDVERKPDPEAIPVVTHSARLVGVEGEEHRSDVVELKRLGVRDRPQRRAVDARDEDPSHRSLGDRELAGDQRHVGDHDARLLEQAELELERR